VRWVFRLSRERRLFNEREFENIGNFVGDGNDTMTLGPGSTVMLGWTVVSNDVGWIGPTNPLGLTASNGSYFFDLQGYSDSDTFGGVTQTITTVKGANYVLSFDLGGATQWGGTDTITACAGATCQLDSITASTNQWDPETLDFTATGGSALISLIGYDGSAYIGLDNVSVTGSTIGTAVPEPVTHSLFGTGHAGAFALRRRKKKAV
jgi:hypothetical protein